MWTSGPRSWISVNSLGTNSSGSMFTYWERAGRSSGRCASLLYVLMTASYFAASSSACRNFFFRLHGGTNKVLQDCSLAQGCQHLYE